MAFFYGLIAVIVFFTMLRRFWRDRSIHLLLVVPYAVLFAALWPLFTVLKFWMEIFDLHRRHY